jgi:hypothetical protein
MQTRHERDQAPTEQGKKRKRLEVEDETEEMDEMDDETYVQWISSEEVQRESREVIARERLADEAWGIQNGKVVRVPNPILAMIAHGELDE